MEFFNAIKEVAVNGKQFKEWEKDDADKNAKRNVLNEKRQFTDEELERFANKGKVMMDVIDIMDTHSEEVAENVETVTMPIAQAAPLGITSLGFLGGAKFYLEPLINKYDDAHFEFMESESGKALDKICEKIKEVKFGNGEVAADIQKLNISRYGKSTKLFSKKNLEIINKSENPLLKEHLDEIKKLSSEYLNKPGIKNCAKKIGIFGAAIGALGVVSYLASNIIAANIQVKSSRIARWQSRNDLNDPKYFVQYTEEQVEEAKQNIANKKDDEGGFFKKGNKFEKRNSFFKTLTSTIADNKAYKEWKKDYNLEDKKVQRNLSEEEIEEAKKDQEVIQRITKQINNQAEEYSENMEVAAGVLIGGTPFLGAAIGKLIDTIVTKTGAGEKLSQNVFNSLIKGADEASKARVTKAFDALKEAEGSVLNKAPKVAEYFKEALSVALDNGGKKMGPISEYFNNIKNVAKIGLTTKGGRSMVFCVAAGLATGIAGSLIGLKLQKSSARAGRYKAKREIEQNPTNFAGYSEKEFEEVKDVKAEKKTALQKFGGYITFLPRVIKDYFDYEKYKKTEAKADKELLEELTKLDVTDKQLEDAQELQRKMFTTFESVDDKSQQYSESIEAVNEMAAPLIPFAGILLAAAPFLVAGLKLRKAGAPKAIETITTFLAKHTNFLKGKTAKKYLEEVGENISATVKSQKYVSRGIEKNGFLKLVEKLPDDVNSKELVAKAKAAYEFIQKEAAGGNLDAYKLIDKILDTNAVKSVTKNDVLPVLETLKNSGAMTTKAEMLDAIIAQVKAMPDEANIVPIIKGFVEPMKDMLTEIKLNPADAIDMIKSHFGLNEEIINSISANVKTAGIGAKGALDALIKNSIKTGKWREGLGKAVKEMPNGVAKSFLNKVLTSSMTDEQALHIFENIQTVFKNIPVEDLNKIIDTAFVEFKNNPQKFAQILAEGKLANIFVTNGMIKAGAIASGTWTALSLTLAFGLESMFGSMQKKAGRLGVMKALEELKDPSFYANTTAKTDDNNNQTMFAKGVQESGLSSMLQNYISSVRAN